MSCCLNTGEIFNLKRGKLIYLTQETHKIRRKQENFNSLATACFVSRSDIAKFLYLNRVKKSIINCCTFSMQMTFQLMWFLSTNQSQFSSPFYIQFMFMTNYVQQYQLFVCQYSNWYSKIILTDWSKESF